MALRRPSVPPAANAEAQSADCCMKFRRDSFDVNMVPLPIGRVTGRDDGPAFCARLCLT